MLDLHLKLGLGDWPVEATLTGTANGSGLPPGLEPDHRPRRSRRISTLDASIENPSAWILLGQAGLSTLDIDADQDGLLSLKIEQSADADPQLAL